MYNLFDPKKPYLAAWTWIGLKGKRSMGDLDERPSSPHFTPLYYAVLCGLSRPTEYLIVAHAEDVNAKDATGWSPLCRASQMGHVDVARVLLDHGADANATNPLMSALRWAYSGDHFEVMKLLLERRADTQGLFGTLLHDATYDGRTEVAQLLLRHRVNVDARGDDNRTPLHFASYYGRRDIVQLLLDHGAEVDPESGFHETPLWEASENGHLEIVRLLLGHEADVHFRKNQDQTAFQIATLNGHHDVAQLLLEHGAVRE
jgi:ankyrin repeat protein